MIFRCRRLSNGLKRFWQGAHCRVLTRDDPPFPRLLDHYQQSDRALVPFEKFAVAIGITSTHVGDGNVLPDEADLLDGKALVAFAEWPSEESGVSFDELISGGDPLTEHVDKVAVLYPALIQSGSVVLVPGCLHGSVHFSDSHLVVRLLLGLG